MENRKPNKECWWCLGTGYVTVTFGNGPSRHAAAEGPCGRCYPERTDAVHPPYAAVKASGDS